MSALGGESEIVGRLLACAYRVISKRLGDGCCSGEVGVRLGRRCRLLPGEGDRPL